VVALAVKYIKFTVEEHANQLSASDPFLGLSITCAGTVDPSEVSETERGGFAIPMETARGLSAHLTLTVVVTPVEFRAHISILINLKDEARNEEVVAVSAVIPNKPASCWAVRPPTVVRPVSVHLTVDFRTGWAL